VKIDTPLPEAFLVIDQFKPLTTPRMEWVDDNKTLVGLIRIGCSSRSMPTRSRSDSSESIRAECLDLMIFLGEASLQRALKEFIRHYHHERNHQSLEHKIQPAAASVNDSVDY
jgi:hypothetical protein